MIALVAMLLLDALRWSFSFLFPNQWIHVDSILWFIFVVRVEQETATVTVIYRKKQQKIVYPRNPIEWPLELILFDVVD